MKSNNTALNRLWVFLLILILVVAMGIIWWQVSTSAVNPQNAAPVTFVVKRGDGVRAIAGNLASANLIRSPTAFFILIKFYGIEKNLEAGDFRLNQAMSAADIAQELTHGYLDVWVTTLEGWRIEEIASALNKSLDIPETQFLPLAKEGYMFPDTYSIPKDATPAAIAQMFLDNFAKKVTSQMRQDAAAQDLTLNQVVILASIVEREGRTDQDRPVIAGILLNRLKAGIALQVDATLQYALGYQPLEKSWWKKSLTDADRKVDSPYNTYLHAGLPPGPIASPGLASIKAVIYPTKSDYLFYLHDSQGQAHYAKTIQEHSANINKYLQ